MTNQVGVSTDGKGFSYYNDDLQSEGLILGSGSFFEISILTDLPWSTLTTIAGPSFYINGTKMNNFSHQINDSGGNAEITIVVDNNTLDAFLTPIPLPEINPIEKIHFFVEELFLPRFAPFENKTVTGVSFEIGGSTTSIDPPPSVITINDDMFDEYYAPPPPPTASPPPTTTTTPPVATPAPTTNDGIFFIAVMFFVIMVLLLSAIFIYF